MGDLRLILHIGGGKTGSSYLQHCFALRRAELEAAGVVYPGHDGSGRAALGAPTSGNGVALARFLRGDHDEPGAVLQALDGALAEAGARDVLLSSEFFEAFREDRFASVATSAERHGFRVELVYYVRSVAGQALSAYRQRVKRHLETRDFTQWLVETYRFRKGDIAAKLERVLPRSALRVHNFDAVRGDLYTHFAEVALNAEAARIVVPPAAVNRSLTDAEVALMRHLNGLLDEPAQGAFVGHALIAAPACGETGTCISREQFELLRELASGQMEQVNRLLPEAEAIDVLGPADRMRENPSEALSDNERMLATVLAALVRERAA